MGRVVAVDFPNQLAGRELKERVNFWISEE